MKQGFYSKYKIQYLGSGSVPKDYLEPISAELHSVAGKIKWFAGTFCSQYSNLFSGGAYLLALFFFLAVLITS
jgi:hypothetical protein